MSNVADWQISKLEHDQEEKFCIKAKGLPAMPVIIGKAGLIAVENKREGDMATPVGRWALRYLYYRRDILGDIKCALSSSVITKNCGWCDDPTHKEYNRYVKLPLAASHERLWRDDGAYDIVLALGYNDMPVVSGMGSAIFLHCIAKGNTYTAGCVAMLHDDLLQLLQLASNNQHLTIDASLLL